MRGAIAGVAAAAAALGGAELVAGASAQWRSPVLDVGDRVVDLVPPPVKDLAISWFGTSDKVALLVGIAVLLGLFAMAIGVLGERGHRVAGVVGIALFGLVGAVAVLSDRGDRPVSAVIPSLVGAFVGAAALWWITSVRPAARPGVIGTGPSTEVAARDQSSADDTPAGTSPASPASSGSRRAFLVRTAAVGAFAVSAAAAGRWASARFSAATARAALLVPKALRPLAPVPASTGFDVEGLAPFVTPNSDFYRIDTALTIPQVDPATWALTVDGMVDRPLSLTFDDLMARDLVEADITMTCVSNEVGGSLVGNARWLGVPLRELLEEAGVSPDSDQLVGRSVDGYTCGFPVASLADDRDALVAVGMNGELLPLRHGFPARLVVAGLYGYVSATKWLSSIELTRFDAFDQYWVPRGYAAVAPIKASSRIDTPKGLARVSPGPVPIAGVAWAQPVGVEAVQVRIDDGPWQPAELAEELSGATWRQWKYLWDAVPGRHTITVRGIDRDGAIQSAERSEPLPDGSSGHHQIVVLVSD